MKDSVAALLADVLEGPVAVNSCDPLSGGASAQMWAVDAHDGSGRKHRFVLRCPGIGEAGMSIGAAAEARVLRLAGEYGVPVPDVPAVFDEQPGLRAGYLMNRLDGEAVPRKLQRDDRYASARSHFVADAARALAAIHSVPAEKTELPTLGASDQLDLLEALHRSLGQAVPTFELALRWLREWPAPATSVTLVHGDFRTGNLLVGDRGLVAVLDWELAHVGDPLEDLGWFCAPAWRFGGAGAAGGFGSREELYTAYEDASGRSVDREAARYWEVLATLKWGVICQFQASRHLGGTPSVEHAAIGRRVTETELDLLLLLDGAA